MGAGETIHNVGGEALNAEVFGPDVHPDGTRVAFAYQQRIWEIGLDGSGLKELASGGLVLSEPVYSPDGTAIAFLGQQSDHDAAINFKTFADGLFHVLDIREQLDATGVPHPPLSWTP